MAMAPRWIQEQPTHDQHRPRTSAHVRRPRHQSSLASSPGLPAERRTDAGADARRRDVARRRLPSGGRGARHDPDPDPLRAEDAGRSAPPARRPRLPHRRHLQPGHLRLGRQLRPDAHRSPGRAGRRRLAASPALVHRQLRDHRRLLHRLHAVGTVQRAAGGSSGSGHFRRSARLRGPHLVDRHVPQRSHLMVEPDRHSGNGLDAQARDRHARGQSACEKGDEGHTGRRGRPQGVSEASMARRPRVRRRPRVVPMGADAVRVGDREGERPHPAHQRLAGHLPRAEPPPIPASPSAGNRRGIVDRAVDASASRRKRDDAQRDAAVVRHEVRPARRSGPTGGRPPRSDWRRRLALVRIVTPRHPYADPAPERLGPPGHRAGGRRADLRLFPR
ncbi:hypothetical protein SGPA1_40040 [Streptomyces misionensis JCM 4497]